MKNSLKTLIQKLPNKSLIIIRGNSLILRNGDVYYPFRQDSDFLYLTELSVPGLVMTIYDKEVILWRESINEHDITWGSDKLTDDEMREISGIENIRDITELKNYCSRHPELAKDPEKTNQEHGCFVPQHDRNNNHWQSIVHELRTIKTPEEIEKIQNCIRITESIYEEILKQIRPGMYEYEIEVLIAHGFRRHHGTEAFPTIVASGINSCTLHYTKNTRRIESDDVVLIDFGIELGGYGADISRTFAVGEFSQRQQEIYDAVLDVKKFAEKTLKPGINRKTWNLGVKEYMYSVCVKLGLKDIENYTPITNPYYPHSIGHFLGLDTHDVGSSDAPFEPGMILTIEPGIYIPDQAIGIRIEDDYLITPDGSVKL